MRKTLLKNSISGIIQFSITTILTFIGIPVFIRVLGTDSYGVFALVSVIGNLNIFADLGLNTSLIKFLAEQGKSQESNYDILITLILLVSFLFPLSLVAFFMRRIILTDLLNIPKSFLSQASVLYSFLLLSNLLLFIGNTFSSILIAMQKLYKSNYIQLIYSFFYWGLIIIVLFFKYNLSMIGKAIFSATVIWFVTVLIVSMKEWGGFPKVSNFHDNFKRVAKKQISYGYKIYISGLLIFFYVPFTKILISNFIGIKEVGYFEIAINIRNRITSFISKAMQPLYPLISEIQDRLKIRTLIHDITQKALFITTPIIAIIYFCTKPFLILWIGGNVDIISIAVIYIAGFYMITIVGTPNYNYLTAKNMVSKTIILQAINVGVNAILILILYRFLKFYAVIVGNVVSIFFSFLLNIYYQKKYLDSIIFDRFSQFMKLVIVFVSLMIVGYFIKEIFHSEWQKLILIPVILTCITILMYRKLRLFSIKDIERYFGKNNLISNIAAGVLLQK